MQKRIYLCLAHMSGNEQRFIQEAFDTNWVVPLGPNVNEFERELKEYTGNEQVEVVALSSGTAAIHLALVALGVKAGDEVMVQSFTFCASANPVFYLGATPVFVDSEPDTWNMDPKLLDEAIADRIRTTGKTPKAIIPVALYGMPPKMDEILAVADKYGIPVIEDTAEALGSCYKGQFCGTMGRFGIMSFNGNKMITTSGGGALICPDAETKRRVMYFATQARQPYLYYQHTEIGYNYRMSNICAGIGRGQMTVVKEHVEHHRNVSRLYQEALAEVPGIAVHVAPSEAYDSNYWLSTITLDEQVKVRSASKDFGLMRTDCEPNPNVMALAEGLDQAGIESRPLWKPLHLQPVFAEMPRYVNGTSEALFRVGLCLPSGPMVSEEDVAYIVQTIKGLLI